MNIEQVSTEVFKKLGIIIFTGACTFLSIKLYNPNAMLSFSFTQLCWAILMFVLGGFLHFLIIEKFK